MNIHMKIIKENERNILYNMHKGTFIPIDIDRFATEFTIKSQK
jgi:hypothetical protein